MLTKSDPYSNTIFFKDLGVMCALDLGTTKFCIANLILPKNAEDPIEILTTCIPAEGMHRGMLADKDKAIKCLTKLVENFEKSYCSDVHKAIVGVAGCHLQGRTLRVTRSLPKKSVFPKDLLELNKQIEHENNSLKREILHTIPVSYAVDSRNKLENPLGLHGDTLSGDFFVIDAEKSYLRDIIDICNKSGLHVVKLYSEPLASSSVTLSDELKALGCSVLDIGGGTSDGLVYINGRPNHLYTINVAGKMMTNDLAIGLGISYRDAETLKLHLGLNNDHFPIEFQDIFGKTKAVFRSEALRILTPRIYELAILVGKELAPFKNYLKGGMILTGGASNVTGIIEIFTKYLGIPTTKIDPELKLFDSRKSHHEFQGPKYSGPMATTLGLIHLEASRLKLSNSDKILTKRSRYFGTIINWLKELY